MLQGLVLSNSIQINSDLKETLGARLDQVKLK